MNTTLFGFSIDEIMETYQDTYSTNELVMAMQLNLRLSDEKASATRHFIAESLSKKPLPVKKCTTNFILPLMRAYYEQPKLF